MNKLKDIIFSNKTLFMSASALLVANLTYDHFEKKELNKYKLYTYDEVSKHNKENDAWVTYKNSVYDISKFIENHPGGKDKVMLALGKGIDNYWEVYKQHTNDPNIFKEILEPMKIGNIENYDENKYKNKNDPYTNDPQRDPELEYHSVSPCNAETPTNNIMDNWITPNNLWYIRNHHPVPDIDPKTFNLEIIYPDSDNINLSFDKIKKMPKSKITTTIQCGGNRRSELNEIDKTSGTPWKYGAISTAEWGGVKLCDLLSDLKHNYELDVKHIQFESYDGVKVSIPVEKALNPYGDVILAYEMNGEELPRDHGYPLRIIVPGYVGIRNLKWVNKIIISDKEAKGMWQKGLSYKSLPSYIKDVKEVDLNKIPTIQEMPVQSCIVDYEIKDNKIKLKGFAWSGGGRGIIRVDVSVDNGTSWHLANLGKGSEQQINKAWAWTFWDIEIDKKNIDTLCCKATDSSYNVQPKDAEHIWNIRGLNNNSWHKININNNLINKSITGDYILKAFAS